MPSLVLRCLSTVAALGIPLLVRGAQTPRALAPPDLRAFEWAFTGSQPLSRFPPSCGKLAIAVTALTSPGVPPFYIIAFPVNGTPVTSVIGTNANALEWTVSHPVGTQLLLGVVDSQGLSYGISDSPLFTVVAGETTECLPAPDTRSPFTVATNSSGTLATCAPWSLAITGGTPPYNVTVAKAGAPDVTNVTLGPTDSVYTYINRGEPNGEIIAAVSDRSGRWASGTPLVHTTSSTDMQCLDLSDTPSSSAGSANLSNSIVSSSRTGSSSQARTSSDTSSGLNRIPSASASPAAPAPAAGVRAVPWRSIAITVAALGAFLCVALGALLWRRRSRVRACTVADGARTVLPFVLSAASSPVSFSVRASKAPASATHELPPPYPSAYPEIHERT